MQPSHGAAAEGSPQAIISSHLGYLDGLRALAAIYVMIHHAILQVDLDFAQLPLALTLIIRAFNHGHYAVGLFIVISGYCLMLPVLRNNGTLPVSLTTFFARRSWRILPPYLLAMALSLALIWTLIGEKTGTHWDESLPVTAKSIITHLLMVHDIVDEDATINHVFWSIAVEWRIYFLFPLLVLGWRRLGPLVTTALTVAVSYPLFIMFGRTIGSSMHIHYLGLFAMGMLAATIVFTGSRQAALLRRLPWGLLTVGLAALIVVLRWLPIWGGKITPAHFTDYVVGVGSLSLIVLVALRPQLWLSRLLGTRPLVWAGAFSYSLYLIHAPLIQLLWQYVFAPLQGSPLAMLAALVFVGGPLMIGASYLFYLACEKPFVIKRQRTVAPAPVPVQA